MTSEAASTTERSTSALPTSDRRAGSTRPRPARRWRHGRLGNQDRDLDLRCRLRMHWRRSEEHNGDDRLYWPTNPGEPPSPLGPFVARARGEGYSKRSPDPVAYWGYYYRILTAQGKDAPGGAYDYLAHGHLMGGFALVAYPARYGVSGVMTFIVNQDGVVYQKDLGPNSAAIARAMKQFNPDGTWRKV